PVRHAVQAFGEGGEVAGVGVRRARLEVTVGDRIGCVHHSTKGRNTRRVTSDRPYSTKMPTSAATKMTTRTMPRSGEIASESCEVATPTRIAKAARKVR